MTQIDWRFVKSLLSRQNTMLSLIRAHAHDEARGAIGESSGANRLWNHLTHLNTQSDVDESPLHGAAPKEKSHQKAAFHLFDEDAYACGQYIGVFDISVNLHIEEFHLLAMQAFGDVIPDANERGRHLTVLIGVDEAESRFEENGLQEVFYEHNGHYPYLLHYRALTAM